MAETRETPSPTQFAQAMQAGLKVTKNAVNELVGPLAVINLAAVKFVSLMAQSSFNAQKLRNELNASVTASGIQNALEGIGMSADGARAKVAELTKLAAAGPFNLASLGEASRNLQVLGGASLNTSANLKKVMDVAAATGNPVDVVATAFGSLTVELQRGGAGAGEAASKLAGLGAISSESAEKIRVLSATGSNTAASFRILNEELVNSRGVAAKMADSIVGLSAQLNGLEEQGNAKIGDKFIEGEKAALRAQIAVQKLKTTIDDVGSSHFAPLVNKFQEVKGAVVEAVAPRLERAVRNHGDEGLSVAEGVIGAGAIGAIPFIGGLVRAAAALKPVQLAIQAIGVALRGVAAVGATALTAETLGTGALIALGVEALKAAANVGKAAEENKKLTKALVEAAAARDKSQGKIDTPADQQNFLTSNSEEQKSLRDQIAEQQQKLTAPSGNLFGRSSEEEAQIQSRIRFLQASLTDAQVREQQVRGLDPANLDYNAQQKESRARESGLREQLRAQAVTRLESITNPAAAVDLASKEASDAQSRLTQARIQFDYLPDDTNKLIQAQNQVNVSKTPDELKVALAALAALKPRTEAGKDFADHSLRDYLVAEKIAAHADLSAGVPGAQERLNVVEEQRKASGYREEDLSPRSRADAGLRGEEKSRLNDLPSALERAAVAAINFQTSLLALAQDSASASATLRQLASQRQLTQLVQGRNIEATGGPSYVGPTQAAIEVNALKEEVAAKTKALAAAYAVEAAVKKQNAHPSAENQADLEKKIAHAATQGAAGKSALQARTEQQQAIGNLQSKKADLTSGAISTLQEFQLSSLREQQQFGDAGQRGAAKKKADALEDTLRKQQVGRELSSVGIDTAHGAGARLAEGVVEQRRVADERALRGVLPVSDLQRVGGEAPTIDPNADLNARDQAAAAKIADATAELQAGASADARSESAETAVSPSTAPDATLQPILSKIDEVVNAIKESKSVAPSGQSAPSTGAAPSPPAESSLPSKNSGFTFQGSKTVGAVGVVAGVAGIGASAVLSAGSARALGLLGVAGKIGGVANAVNMARDAVDLVLHSDKIQKNTDRVSSLPWGKRVLAGLANPVTSIASAGTTGAKALGVAIDASQSSAEAARLQENLDKKKRAFSSPLSLSHGRSVGSQVPLTPAAPRHPASSADTRALHEMNAHLSSLVNQGNRTLAIARNLTFGIEA